MNATVFEDTVSDDKQSYAVVCTEPKDLSLDRILICLSAMRAKLAMNMVPDKIRCIECYMSPTVKKNIIMASRKLNMFGKKPPIVSRFDECGRKLPDELEIVTEEKMVIHIVDPIEDGTYYLKLIAIRKELPQLIEDMSLFDNSLPF